MAGNIFDDTLEQLPPAPSNAPAPAPVVDAADDPYGAAADQVIARRLEQQHKGLDRAAETAPDRAAGVISLSQRYGLAPGVVDRNFDALQQRAKREDTPHDVLLRDTPALAQYLSDPYRAAAVQDDIQPLAVLEKTVRVAGTSVRALASGIPRVNAGMWGLIESAAETAGNPQIAALAKTLRVEGHKDADFLRGAQEGGELEKAFYAGWESLGVMIPGALMSMATGTPGPMLATMGASTAGESYGRGRDEGLGVGRANLFALTQGGIEVATEMIPASRFMKDLASNAGFRKMILGQLGSEIPGEQVATALQDLDEWATLNPEAPFSEYVYARPDAFVQTLVSTITSVGALTAVTATLQKFAGENGKAERADQSKGVFDAIAGAVGSMKTGQTFPESIEAVIEGAEPNAKFYMPIDTFSTYWQEQGEDPAAKAAELTGNPNAYTQALKTGADLPIPVAAYAAKISNTDHNAYFVEELRLGPDEMNRREAAVFKAEQAAAATLAQDEATEPETSPTAPIRAALLGQLEAAGVETSTASSYVDLYESVFSSLGERAGVDPVKLFEDYGVTVGRPDLGPPAPNVAPPAPMPTQLPAPIEKPAAAPAVDPAHAKAAEHAERYAPYLDVLEAFPTIDVSAQGPRAVAEAYFDAVYGEAAIGVPAMRDALITATNKIATTKGEQKVAILDWIRTNEAKRQAFEAEPAIPETPLEAGVVDAAGRPIGGTERRSVNRGAAPGGVDRRDAPMGLQPNFSRGDVGALAAQMRAGNPNIMREAEAMRTRASEVGRIEEPAELRAARKGAKVLDKNAAQADTIEEGEDASTEQAANRIIDQGGSPAANRIAASDPGRGAINGTRAEKHFTRVFGSILESAREIDPAVDEARLREEFDFRVSFMLDQQQLAANEGRSPHELLREIARLGGLYEKDDGRGLHAELKSLGAGAPFGALAGIRGVFAAKQISRTQNQKARGHGVDVMLQMLQSDDRFSWIENVDMLIDQIDEASRHGADKFTVMLPGTEELRDAGIRREKRWWPDGWAAGDMLADIDESIIAGAEGDTSFDVTEFNQSLFDEFDALEDPGAVDTLATGEQQPRLPEAGTVRDREVATPEIAELPFSLTSEIAKPGKKNAGQKTLFQPVELTRESVNQWADDMKAIAGEDLKSFVVNLTLTGDISLDSIIIARGAQRAGLGSKLLRQLTRFADTHGRRLILTPGQRDSVHGTTSRARLVRFYKRFGFVENKGRNTDFTISAGMLREPTLPALGRAGDPTKQVDTPAFKAWFRESKVVDEDGQPLRLFHGTTGTFESFDRDRGNIESDFGAGIYFSSNAADVGANYAGIGPDMKSKIERRAERVQDQFADNDGQSDDTPGPTVERVTAILAGAGLTLETATAKDRTAAFETIAAEQIGVEHGGLTMPVYVKMENPAIVGGDNGTVLTLEQEFPPLSDFQDDEIEELRADGLEDDEIRRELADRNSYEPEQKGTLPAFTEALRNVASRYNDAEIDDAIQEINDEASYESIELVRAIEILKNNASFGYSTDDEGNLAGNEIIRLTLQNAGFDGIEDHTVDIKFGSQRRLGKSMEGMDPGTVHYIAFKPTQIKSAIGNAGTFNPRSASILNQGQDDGTKRGAIRFGPDRQMSITLLQKANLSTFLHESGHLFLEVFGDVAEKLSKQDTFTPQQRQAVIDYNTLIEWLGVDSRAGIDEKAHEQFARGFEAYLMEGKAPSQGLRSAFARYRAWLLGIYKSLRGLRVNLTDDVRRVLDRMVATDQAIAEARAQAQIVPMFTTAESAGMAPEVFELYRQKIADEVTAARERLEVQVLSEVRREQESTWKEQRAAIHGTVEAETHAMPVYVAMAAIQRGTKPDGSAIVDGLESEPLKLSRKMLADRFGVDRLKRLPRPYVYTRDGGLDPEVVAPMFGYSSADEMLRAIEEAEPMARRIERETDRRMLAENGSMLLDGTLPEKAQGALANDQREAIVREELRALSRLRRQVSPFVRQARQAVAAEKNAEIDALAGEVSALKAKTRGGAATINAAIPPDDVVREAAKLTVAGMRVRDIKPNVYWAAARRAGQKALAAAAKQDFDTAIREKQHELMSLAVYREATAVLEDVDARVKRAQDLARPSAQQRLGKAGDSYRNQVNQILDQYDFSRQTGKALDRRESLRGWVAALQAQGLAVEIPDDVLDDARRIPYRDLTTEELIGITDALDHIVHLSRLKGRLLKNQDEREFEVVRDRLVSSIRANNQENKLPVAFRRRDRARRKFREWFASHARMATVAQLMDGREDGGEAWSAFVRPVNEAASQKQIRFTAAAKGFGEIMAAHYPGRALNRLHDKLHIPEINDSLTLDERIAVARNWGNATSRDRMLNDPRRKWNQQQIMAILDTLDKNDLSFVQATFDFINQFWPEIAAKQKRVTGLEPEKVEAVEIVTKQGTIPGGYFPLVADSRYNAATRQWEKLAEAELKTTAAYVSSTTKRGHVKARQQHARYTVKLEGGVVFGHLEQVLHDLTHHEMLIDTTRLLRDSKVSEAMYDTVGDVVYDQIAGALEAIAAGRLDGARNMVDEAAQFMKTRVQMALLGYNLWTGLQQPLGLLNGADRVGARWVAKGMYRWLTSPIRMEKTVTWIHEVSPFMAGRAGTATQDLADLRRAFAQPGGWFDSMVRTVSRDTLTQQRLLDSFLWHIGVMQRVADVPTWLGQYEKSKAAGETDARAVALADQAIIDAQGSGRISDLAQVQRGGPVAQLYMTFYSYGSTTYNAAYRRAGRTDFKKPIQVAQFLGGLSLIYILPAIGTVLLSQMVGRTGGDDEEPEDWWTEVARESAASALNGMVIVRELSQVAREETRGYSGPAGARLLVTMNQFLTEAKQGELDDALLRKGLAVGGAIFGLPAAQMQRTIDGWRAIQEEDADYGALFVGPPKK